MATGRRYHLRYRRGSGADWSGAWSLDLGREKMLQLLDLPSSPTAVFCFSDRVAMGAYDAIRPRGLKIPDDISVVGLR